MLAITVGEEDGRHPGATGGENLLLDPADREDPTGEGELAGHGDVAARRAMGEKGDEGGGDGNPRRRAVFGGRPGRDMNVDIAIIEDGRIDGKVGGMGANVGQGRLG